jgi:hypothetical protein
MVISERIPSPDFSDSSTRQSSSTDTEQQRQSDCQWSGSKKERFADRFRKAKQSTKKETVSQTYFKRAQFSPAEPNPHLEHRYAGIFSLAHQRPHLTHVSAFAPKEQKLHTLARYRSCLGAHCSHTEQFSGNLPEPQLPQSYLKSVSAKYLSQSIKNQNQKRKKKKKLT